MPETSVPTLLTSCLLLLGMSTFIPGQDSAPIPIWSNPAPGALGTAAHDIPTLTPYLPAAEKATGAAIVICPGGGYGGLAGHEGRDYALWLSQRGIAGFVLKYRLGSNGYRHPAMLNDIQRAVRVVRSSAATWKLKSDQIGVMGSSAGGHLAATAATHFTAGDTNAADPIERVSSRPDLAILCYAVISMGPQSHAGSRKNLLGPTPDPALVTLLSNELHVTKDTPPSFLWHTADDAAVPVANSLLFASALSANGVPYELHIYQNGRHGLGLGVKGYDPATTDPTTLLPWTVELDRWLHLRGFAK